MNDYYLAYPLYGIFSESKDKKRQGKPRSDGYYDENGVFHADKKGKPNEPCPCGSGKKYKKCCGRRDV
jgi:uncharacterized protein YchJ